MRPLKLSLQAFGPFATKEEIDFTAFGDNAFFLIHGPTGAGKTSILDGICYALYASASGSARDENTLRSQHAKGDLLCEVDFLFQVGPRVFSISRSPEQILVKNGKEQKSAHKVEMCEVDATGAIIGSRLTKVREVEQKVEEILGFTADQFRQVVILPQGEFRKLLLASSTDKEKILEKLFATERFKRIESMLKDRRDALYKSLEGIRNTVKGILEGQEVASPEALTEKLASLEEKRKEKAETSARASEKLSRASEALQQGHLIAEKFLRLEIARKESADLEQQRGSMEIEASRAERGKRALTLVDLDESLNRDRLQQKSLAELIRQLDGDLVRINGELSVAVGERDALKEQAGEIPRKTGELELLKGRLRLLGEIGGIEAELKTALLNRSNATTALEHLQSEILNTEQARAADSIKIEELSLTTGKRGELEQRLKEAESNARARKELAEAESLILKQTAAREKLVAGAASADGELAKASSMHEELTRRFIQGQASRLARELADGHPCPVCGSPDHPVPAAGGDNVPTDEEIEAASNEVDSAREKSEKGKTALSDHDVVAAKARAAAEALRKQLGAVAELPLQNMLDTARSFNEELRKAACDEAELLKIRESRDSFTRSLATAKGKLPGVTATVQEASTRADTLSGQHQAKLNELGDGSREEQAIKKEITSRERFIADTAANLKLMEERVTKLEKDVSARSGKRDEAMRNGQELELRVSDAEGRFAKRISQAGFKGEEEYRGSRMSPEELEQAEKKITAWRDRVTAANAELAQATTACEGQELPDIHGLASTRSAAEDEVKAIAAEIGAISSQIGSVTQAITSIDTYQKQSGEQERQYRVVGNLANLASGSNPKRITLQRFVLATLFEEVALAASARLSRMSRGRYHLRRAEDVTNLKKSGGLDLEVTDDFTGLHRPASSLSGGETFLASLSLALGLSDVVLAQSGGRYLDTLFIDEGFGTLDPETLDIAMDTLIRLNEQGRMVGIISHVAELKEQIPSRVEVLAGRNGSRVNLVC